MSTLNKASIDPTIEFCESIRKRVLQLSERAESSASALADAAIAALTALRCERDLRDLRDPNSARDALADGWINRVAETFDLAWSLVDKVESQDERDYLLRLFIESTVDVLPAESDLWDKTLALLDKTSDSDERQLATLALAIGMAKRTPRLPYSEEEPRRRARELAETLEDADDYERAMGYVLAGTRASIELLDDEEAESARREFRDKELDKFFVDATIEGVVRYFNETALEFVNLLPVSRAYVVCSEAWSGLRDALERIERGIETRVLRERVESGWEESDLDDDEIDDLKSLLKNLVVSNPIAANYGEETRAFVERWNAFGTIEKQLAFMASATSTAAVGDASAQPLFFRDEACYRSERAAWIELAEKLARADGLLPQEKASRLTSLAKTRFEDGDKERGRAAVLEVLALLPQLESAGYAEPRLKELVQIHLDCRQTKPAARLAALLDEKIAAQTEPMMRDYRRDDVFATYLRVFDEPRLEEALNSFESSVYRTTWRARSLVARAFTNFRESNDAETFRRELEAAAAYLAEAQEREDPVLAASSLRDLAEFAAEQAR